MKDEWRTAAPRPRICIHPSSFSFHPFPPAEAVGLEPTIRPRRTPVFETGSSSKPDDFRCVRQPVSCQVRGEGFEPSSPGSKSGSLPLADPRARAAAAEIEPAIVSLTGSRRTIGLHRIN